MERSIIEKIDRRIDDLRQELADITIDLVNIKSEKGTPLPGAPFGEGPRRVLDRMLEMGQAAGFYTRDYGVGVVSLAMQDKAPDVGIWLHGDVVPAGDGWHFPPYNASEYKGCVIGRGATDNKGQLAAVFLLLRLFKELDIRLRYNPAIYIGSDEESGMADMIGIPGDPEAKGFLNVAEPPRLSLVPDEGFSVGYGGKGSVTLTLRSNLPLQSCNLTAGLPDDPGLATAVFHADILPQEIPNCTVKGNTVTTWTSPRHGASPDPNGNMITVLSDALLENNIVPEEERHIWEFLRTVSTDIYGKTLGIAATSAHMKPLTVFTKQVTMADGHIDVTLNIRYPDSITCEQIVSRVSDAAGVYGFSLTESKAGTSAYLAPVDTPVVQVLCAASCEVIGTDIPPFTLSGGTYAHRLPNAYVFGMNGCLPPEDFPKGCGNAHGVDECVSLDRLQRAMRIYARALLWLDALL